MRRPLPLLLAAAASLAAAGEPQPLDIRPAETDAWKAPRANVLAVLRSAAEQLWRHFPDRALAPIEVEPRGGPIVAFQRGPGGAYYVRLNTGGLFWAQYAYQFAHELCHILCGYEPTEKANKWFEESLCEVASLFVLRRMAAEWSLQPPYPNWRDFSKALWDYADERIQGARLPDDLTLAEWYRQHAAGLRKTPCHRERNTRVAVALLPLFERQPQHWAAVSALNAAAREEPRSFPRYLADWHANAPEAHRAFIRRIAAQFGIPIRP